MGSWLTVRNSLIIGNASVFDGGGIYMSSGLMVIENTTISGNASNAASSGGGGITIGGATFNSGPPGYTPRTNIIRNSTIANNFSPGVGGGIDVRGPTSSGTLLIQNTTITANTAVTLGGGIASP